MVEEELKIPDLVKSQLTEQVTLGEKLSRALVKAVITAKGYNCECEVCKIIKEIIPDFLASLK